MLSSVKAELEGRWNIYFSVHVVLLTLLEHSITSNFIFILILTPPNLLNRVQPGVCYHLFSKAREMTLENYPLPEMLRSRLDEVIIRIKMLQLGAASPFLNKVMNPPDPLAVSHSLEVRTQENNLFIQ